MAAFSIGRLSKRAGVKVPTIRYYESIGLLNAPRRTEGGQRIYANADIERLAFIRHARELGFSMKMIRNLLHLQAQPSGDCRDVERIVRAQLGEVRSRLSALTALEQELLRLIDGCAGGRIDRCEIIAALNDHDRCVSDAHDPVASF